MKILALRSRLLEDFPVSFFQTHKERDAVRYYTQHRADWYDREEGNKGREILPGETRLDFVFSPYVTGYPLIDDGVSFQTHPSPSFLYYEVLSKPVNFQTHLLSRSSPLASMLRNLRCDLARFIFQAGNLKYFIFRNATEKMDDRFDESRSWIHFCAIFFLEYIAI